MSNYFEFEKRNLQMFINCYKKGHGADNLESAKRTLKRMHRKGLISGNEKEKLLEELEEM